jgi:hypothetical protein
MEFFSWTFWTSRVLCTWMKTLFAVSYTPIHLVSINGFLDLLIVNFLDLLIIRSPRDLSCAIVYVHTLSEYANIDMICMPHVHSKVSITAELGTINSQF